MTNFQQFVIGKYDDGKFILDGGRNTPMPYPNIDMILENYPDCCELYSDSRYNHQVRQEYVVGNEKNIIVLYYLDIPRSLTRWILTNTKQIDIFLNM